MGAQQRHELALAGRQGVAALADAGLEPGRQAGQPVTQAELLGAVTCPQLLLACGNDPDSVKVGGLDQRTLRARGVLCECLEFSEMRHGFLARGDYAGDAAVRRDAGMCVQRILDFLRTHLPPLPPPPELRAEIKWGILGVGDVCEIKSGPAFQKCKGSSLQAVMRRTASRAHDFAERHGVPAWYADADALLADPNVNAVYIATPPGSHLELALKCCAAGKPTYLEKPAARNAPV